MTELNRQSKKITILRIIILFLGLAVPASFQIYGGIDLLFREFIRPFLFWTAYAMLPYIILFGISFKIKSPIILIISILLLFVIELFVNIQIIMAESRELSTLLLTFLPVYQTVITLPFSLLVGWIVQKVHSKRPPLVLRR